MEDIKSRDPTFKPALVIVQVRSATTNKQTWHIKTPIFCLLTKQTQVGGREDSNVYIRMKLKAAEEIGW